MNVLNWLSRREDGRPPKFGEGDALMKRIYNSLNVISSWNEAPSSGAAGSEYGAVFNVEFCPGRNVLGAACEKKTVVLFDVISQQEAHVIKNAHDQCVNCIRFIENYTFATCSDDATVALWDMRYLKKTCHMLGGHNNWVKNVEYSRKDKLLVTSGLDGCVLTWDIHSQTNGHINHQQVLSTTGLMRCRLSPTGDKMVLCTTGGYLMIIHELDLSTLLRDLSGFKPSLYRLMQIGNQFLPLAAQYDYVLTKQQKKNRVEFVTDFPCGDDAEILVALQVHPSGQSFISRNIAYDEQTEWTCIHDFNEESRDIEVPQKRKRKLKSVDKKTSSPRNETVRTNSTETENTDDGPSTSAGILPNRTGNFIIEYELNVSDNDGRNNSARSSRTRNTNGNRARSNRNANNQRVVWHRTLNLPTIESIPDIWAAEITVEERESRQNRGRSMNSVRGYDYVYAVSSGLIPIQSMATESNGGEDNIENEKHIIQNASKLMYYTQETMCASSYIKEPSFSADGRIICSPHENGVRLFAFNDSCSEHPDRHTCQELKKAPQKLVHLKTMNCHSDAVLCSSFCPSQPVLVTGCRRGKIAWHYPNI